ncbi:unnamed protein product [Leptosia nina]|uniref:Uncharacterized protein n=1 Tax=Leptosia nina TaxID=320188 RepID=A0AAV1JV68_9NEOP
MKILIVMAALFAAVACKNTFFYTTADDNLDVDAIIRNRRKLEDFGDCFLGRKPCDEVAASYKVILPEAISQACRRCTGAQKRSLHGLMLGFASQLPERYEAIVLKCDPRGIHIDSFWKSIKGF